MIIPCFKILQHDTYLSIIRGLLPAMCLTQNITCLFPVQPNAYSPMMPQIRTKVVVICRLIRLITLVTGNIEDGQE